MLNDTKYAFGQKYKKVTQHKMDQLNMDDLRSRTSTEQRYIKTNINIYYTHPNGFLYKASVKYSTLREENGRTPKVKKPTIF